MFGWWGGSTEAQVNAVLVREQKKLIDTLTASLLESAAMIDSQTATMKVLTAEMTAQTDLINKQAAELRRRSA